MKKLSYKTLEDIGYDGYLLKDGKERMLQFGEGNFLRAFVDYFVDELNEKADFGCKVVVCQPIEQGLTDIINEQEGLYTLYLRGYENGKHVNKKRVISSVGRCINPYKEFDELMSIAKNPDLRFITSNTTEAGIAYDSDCKFDDKPPKSFPAKLTRFLYERFTTFAGDTKKGMVILSCELIDNNGDELKKCVKKHIKDWSLGDEFDIWIENSNKFCSTLVDRIVTGYPKNEAENINVINGYIDNLLDTGETFGFWVIECDESLKDEMPFEKAGLPVVITDDHSPYKQRKVRILNGAHTTLILGAYLAGKNIVRECMQDETMRSFMNKTIFEEIMPTLTLDKNELTEFAQAVIDRFNNPFIDHELLSISLNSTSKWRARVLPSLVEYIAKTEKIPQRIAASFAFYISFYRGTEMRDGILYAHRDNAEYKILDDSEVIEFFYNNKTLNDEQLVKVVCSNISFWGQDLTKIVGFEACVLDYIKKINQSGCYEVMKALS